MYCVRMAYGRRTLRCRGVSKLRQCGVAWVTITSMRRPQAKSHRPILSKVMDVEKPGLKIAVVGLLWSLLQNEKHKKACSKTEAWQQHCSGPYCEKGVECDNLEGGCWGFGYILKEDFSMVITIALWKRIATGRQRLFRNFLWIESAIFGEFSRTLGTGKQLDLA